MDLPKDNLQKKRLNLPNRISLTRIGLIPLIVAVFYLPFDWAGFVAALLFTLAAVTDFLDGHIARKRGLVTNMGKFLDPIADKVLVLAALFITVESGLMLPVVGAVCGTVIIARELIIGGFRQIAAANGVIIAADKAGKIKAVFQDVAMGLFLALKTFNIVLYSPDAVTALYWLCHAVLFVAVLLTVWSGVAYIVRNKQVFAQ